MDINDVPISVQKQIIQKYLDEVKYKLKTEQRAKIKGIVILNIKHRKALPRRKGRNPATGEEIWIKARKADKVVKARPVKELKEIVKKRSKRKR